MGYKTSLATMEKKLSKLYFNPSNEAGYGGVGKLQKKSNLKLKNVSNWLEGQESYTLHKPIKYKFERRRTIVARPFDQAQMDLLDMSAYKNKNKGTKFLLVIVDIFSKYCWVRPLKNKTGEVVLKGLEFVLKDKYGKRIKSIQSDKGTEFLNRKVQSFLQKKNIGFFTSENEDIKCSIVERLNRTLQTKLYRYLTSENTESYLDVLQKIVEGYNNSNHSTTGFSPKEVAEHVVSKTPLPGGKTLEDIWHRVYKRKKSYWKPNISASLYLKNKKKGSIHHSLKKGDYVRINKTRKVFKKGYLPGWSRELFIVQEIVLSTPITFKIKDLKEEKIKGNFYKEELQKVKPPSFYNIEKVLKTQKTKEGKRYLVKWTGYGPEHNSWITEKNLKKIK